MQQVFLRQFVFGVVDVVWWTMVAEARVQGVRGSPIFVYFLFRIHVSGNFKTLDIPIMCLVVCLSQTFATATGRGNVGIPSYLWRMGVYN